MKESLRQCIRPLGGEFSPGLDEIRRVPVLRNPSATEWPIRQTGFRHAVVTVLSSLLFRCRPWWGNLMCCVVMPARQGVVPELPDSPDPLRAPPKRYVPTCLPSQRSRRCAVPSSQVTSSIRPSQFCLASIATRQPEPNELGSCADNGCHAC